MVADPDGASRLQLAIEHLRMTVLSARAVDCTQSVVGIADVERLLAEYDRLAATTPTGPVWDNAYTAWGHGARSADGTVTIWPMTTKAEAYVEVARLRARSREGSRYAVLRREVGPAVEADELGASDD